MKRTLLTLMCSLATVPVFAMEPLADDSLAETVGQSGLTIELGPKNITANHLRYADSDGYAGAPNPAALDIANLQISNPGSTRITLDVGSTGHGSAAQTGLLLGIGPITGMSVTTGNISVDNGSAITLGTVAGTPFAQFSATSIDLSAINLLISPGGQTHSGMTFTTLSPINISANLMVTEMVNSSLSSGTVSGQAVVSGLEVGGATFDVGSNGLDISTGSMTATAIEMNNIHLGSTAPGFDIGNIAVYNVNASNTTVQILGH